MRSFVSGLLALVGMGLSISPVWGQQTPATDVSQGEGAKFEIVSIRPIGEQELRVAEAKGFTGILPCNGGFQITPGRLTVTATTAFRLIAMAYGLPCGAALDVKLIAGGPEWIQKDAYHIQATLPSAAPKYTLQQLQNGEAPVLQEMLRNLLAERFHLAVQRSTKVMSTYNIYATKDTKVKPSADQTASDLSLVSGTRGNFDMAVDRTNGIARLRATAIPMARLITPMQGRDGRVVIDRTGMTGVYDIAAIAIDVGPSAAGVSVWPEILTGLGFKVEASRGPVEFLTIQRMERPTEN